MTFHSTSIAGLWLIKPEIRSDDRGSFHRVWDMEALRQANFSKAFVQHNHSTNLRRGTVRGMHYQLPPVMDAKIIKCTRGRLLDVAVDIRRGSPTFLKHVAVQLDDQRHEMMLVPEGCAHGFQTLDDNTEVLYYHTAAYAPHLEAGLRYDDPMLNIQWPLAVSGTSERDKSFPLLTGTFTGLAI